MFTQYRKFIELAKDDKSSHTIRSYSSNLESFFNGLNIVNLESFEDVSTMDIRNYLSGMSKENKASTVNARLRIIRVFFNWMVANEFIENNSASGIKNFKEPKTIPVILTQNERDNIILACGNNLKLKLIMAILLYTGLRREEVTNIKLEDISDGKLLVHGKGNKERILAINEYVQNLIKEYLEKRGTNFEYLFCSQKGFGSSSGHWHKVSAEAIRQGVKKAAGLAGIDEKRIEGISCHTMRRTFACDLARNQVSAFQIQKAVGHENITTTNLYLRAARADIADGALMAQAAPGS